MNIRNLKITGIGLAGLTAAAHIFVGSYDTLFPLLESDLNMAIKGTFHACWHFISVFLAFSVWSFYKETASAKTIAQLWIAFAVCFFMVGLYSAGLRGLMILPQWSLLCAAGILVLLYFRQVENKPT